MTERTTLSSTGVSTPMRQIRSAASAYVGESAASTAQMSTARLISDSPLWLRPVHCCAPTLPLPTRSDPVVPLADANLSSPNVRSGVKTGKAQCEHMFSALPPRADIAQYSRHVRFVPSSDSCTAEDGIAIRSLDRRIP